MSSERVAQTSFGFQDPDSDGSLEVIIPEVFLHILQSLIEYPFVSSH